MKSIRFFSRDQAQRSAGFSLLELAIGMAVVGLVLGGGLLIAGKRWEVDRRVETQAYVSEAKQALLRFARTNGALPQLDTANASGVTDGIADRLSNGSPVFGWLPYANLGVARTDAYGSQLLYMAPWFLMTNSGRDACKAMDLVFKGYLNTTAFSEEAYLAYLYLPSDGWVNNWFCNWAWYPKVRFADTSMYLPVAAVLISPGATDKDKKGTAPGDTYRYKFDGVLSNPNNSDAHTRDTGSNQITFHVYSYNVSQNYDDVAEYVTVSELYDALNCKGYY